MYIFCLKLKKRPAMLYEDVKLTFKFMCSLVKQNVC